MTAVYLGTFRPGSSEWRQHRADKVGGSDIAAIVGVSPWASPYSLWQERKGNVQPGGEIPEMTWGNRLEPVIAQAFQDAHPDMRVQYQPGAVFAHPERPWQVASPDALILGDGDDPDPVSGLEIKTSRYDDEWAAGPPPHYETQIQWCMDVFGLPDWHVAALFAGSDYREYTVNANPAIQDALRDLASEFLASLAAGEPPPLDGTRHTYQAVKGLHPLIDDEDVDIPDELAAEYVAALRAFKQAEAAKNLACSKVANHMGRARRAMWNGQRIAYRQPGRVGSTPFLKQAHGLLLDRDLAAL